MNIRLIRKGFSCYVVWKGEDAFLFSDETCVAFRIGSGTPWNVSENVWSKTTGKHLNQIDGGDKKSRLPYEEFCKRLSEL